MSRPDAAALLPLAESIADGGIVDWEAAEAIATAEQRAVIRELRVLSNLVGLHRSLPVDDPGRRPDSRSGASPAIGSWAHLTLLERLGGGTSGDVYRAWDRHLERDVALKLLKADESVEDLHASRIAAEGRLLARVHHPNVVAVHGVDTHEQRVGLWMELVRGATLEQGLQEHGPLSASEAALVGIDLCRALAAIHAAGLIHRDVKAQNVMREDGGRIVLMDLGTGRETDQGGRRALHDLAGTPLYLAPEIFDGAPASERTDLYSLGVLLYHLVTGSFPVRATTLEDLKRGHRNGTGVRLRDARADLPTAFVQVVERATATDPESRYDSAGALEADLVRAIDGTVVVLEAVRPPADNQVSTRRWNWRRAGATLLIAATALLVLVAVAWPTLRSWRSPEPVVSHVRSIAVLPLVNLSGDASQEYFADGLTDELIGTLGQLGDINVISRTSAMQFKGSKRPLPEIARTLHVDAVLEASVLVLNGPSNESRGSKRVRINARLIQAQSDTQLWNRTFEAVVGDVLTLQRVVARAVADGINLRLTTQQQRSLAKTPGETVGGQRFEVIDLYLRGRYYWNLRTQSGLMQSTRYFQEAIDRDPRFALGYAGLADAFNVIAMYAYAPRGQALQRAHAAAVRALEIDDGVAEAHASLGFIHNEWLEWEAAEKEFKRAIALKPGYAEAHHWYANFLAEFGRFPEALAAIDHALELDPLSVGTHTARGSILMLARNYPDALVQLEQAARMNPDFARPHMIMAEALAHARDYPRAFTEIEKALSLQSGGGAELRADVGYISAVAGRRPEALKAVDELVERFRQHEDGAAGSVAVVYAGLGDNDRVFEWLNRARSLRDPVISDLNTDPRFDKMRTDPRFAKLLADVGFPG